MFYHQRWKWIHLECKHKENKKIKMLGQQKKGISEKERQKLIFREEKEKKNM